MTSMRASCDGSKLPATKACRRLAEAGCSPHEIMAIGGQRTLAEVTRHTVAANRLHLADRAAAALEQKEARTKTAKPAIKVYRNAPQVVDFMGLNFGGGGCSPARTGLGGARTDVTEEMWSKYQGVARGSAKPACHRTCETRVAGGRFRGRMVDLLVACPASSVIHPDWIAGYPASYALGPAFWTVIQEDCAVSRSDCLETGRNVAGPDVLPFVQDTQLSALAGAGRYARPLSRAPSRQAGCLQGRAPAMS